VIERAFNSVLAVEPSKDTSTVYVTELSGCLRKSWYRRNTGYRVTKDMLAGQAIHRELLESVASALMGSMAGAHIKVEKLVTAVFDNVELRGRVDLFILSNDVRTFVEFKTSDWILDEHIMQANIYAAMLDVDRFYICYMPRSSDVKCVELKRRMDREDVERRVLKFVKALELGEPPKKEENYWCYYCEYRNMCRKNKTLF